MTLVFTNPTMVESAYMLSSVFFILSLGGLSNPESSKKSNLYEMYEMFIAIFATSFTDFIDDKFICSLRKFVNHFDLIIRHKF